MESTTNNKSESLIESMFQAGAHYGYSKTKRHPSFASCLFGSKDKVDIIDLEKTGSFLNRALEYVTECAKNEKVVLFVGTKPEARCVIEETICPLGFSYVSHKWIGGTLTNMSEMRKRITRLEKLQEKQEKGELDVYTKKERKLIEKEMGGLLLNFGGIVSMKKLPDVLFVVDPKNEHTAIKEAKRKNIPVVALAGSDCDIKNIQYPIPANDSSLRSIRFFVEKIAKAYQDGQNAVKPETADS